MTREVKGFLAMVPPTVTHNDLRPALRAGGPYIRKSDRLRDAEAALEARLRPLRPHDGPLSGPLLVEVRWCFPAGSHGQGEPHTDRPDMSNMLKTLEDCMVRTGWIADDRMICQERTAKAWMDPAGIWVRAAELA